MTRTEGYYWVREAGGAAQIAEWARTDNGEWRWALTGCSIGIPDQRMTPISGLLSAPEESGQSKTSGDYDLVSVRLGALRGDVIAAAQRFDACMSEFEGDLSCCHDALGTLFETIAKLRKEEDIETHG